MHGWLPHVSRRRCWGPPTRSTQSCAMRSPARRASHRTRSLFTRHRTPSRGGVQPRPTGSARWSTKACCPSTNDRHRSASTHAAPRRRCSSRRSRPRRRPRAGSSSTAGSRSGSDPTPPRSICSRARDRIAIEIDGYHHFADAERYRRDRRKDLLLQSHGLLVIRLLAEDVMRDPIACVNMVCQALAARRST